MKKFFNVLLSLVLTMTMVLSLTACDGLFADEDSSQASSASDSETSETHSGGESSKNESEPENEEPITMLGYWVGTGNGADENGEEININMAMFFREDTAVWINTDEGDAALLGYTVEDKTITFEEMGMSATVELSSTSLTITFEEGAYNLKRADKTDCVLEGEWVGEMTYTGEETREAEFIFVDNKMIIIETQTGYATIADYSFDGKTLELEDVGEVEFEYDDNKLYFEFSNEYGGVYGFSLERV